MPHAPVLTRASRRARARLRARYRGAAAARQEEARRRPSRRRLAAQSGVAPPWSSWRMATTTSWRRSPRRTRPAHAGRGTARARCSRLGLPATCPSALRRTHALLAPPPARRPRPHRQRRATTARGCRAACSTYPPDRACTSGGSPRQRRRSYRRRAPSPHLAGAQRARPSRCKRRRCPRRAAVTRGASELGCEALGRRQARAGSGAGRRAPCARPN